MYQLLAMPLALLFAAPTMEQVSVVDGFAEPETVCIAEDGSIFVSNVATETEGWWEDDGEGFISKLSAEGEIEELRWIDGLNAPKGMCIQDGMLYIADNTRLVVCDIEKAEVVRTFEPRGATGLNDVTTDGKSIFISDSVGFSVFQAVGEISTRLDVPPGINGLQWHGGKLYGAVGNHVTVIDLSGQGQHEPLELDRGFTGLDGIEFIDDRTLVLTDYFANSIYFADINTNEVSLVAQLEHPANLGVDADGGLAYVPQLLDDTVVIFEISADDAPG